MRRDKVCCRAGNIRPAFLCPKNSGARRRVFACAAVKAATRRAVPLYRNQTESPADIRVPSNKPRFSIILVGGTRIVAEPEAVPNHEPSSLGIGADGSSRLVEKVG